MAANKKPSLADQIREAEDRPTEEMEIPEWGVTLPLRALSAWQQSQYEDSLIDIEQDEEGNIVRQRTVVLGAAIRLAAMGVADDSIDEALLKDKSPVVVNRIASRVREISGMDRKAAEAAVKG